MALNMELHPVLQKMILAGKKITVQIPNTAGMQPRNVPLETIVDTVNNGTAEQAARYLKHRALFVPSAPVEKVTKKEKTK